MSTSTKGYYYDLEIGAVDPSLLGTVIEIPVELTANGLPSGYEAPPARLALRYPDGPVPDMVYGPAHSLALTDTLPANISLLEAALVSEAQGAALMNATDYDAQHPLSDTAATVFSAFTSTLSFSLADGVITFDLPPERQTLPASDGPLYVAARAVITHAHHGPNLVNAGPMIRYIDPFGVTWYERGSPFTVEAAGADVGVTYYCDGAAPGYEESVVANGAGWCGVMPGETSQIVVRVTAYNEGGAIARCNTLTLAVPDGLPIVAGNPPWIRMDGNDPTWNLGDLAPGGWKSFEAVIQIEAIKGEKERTVIEESRGIFLDGFSALRVTGQFGGRFQVGVLDRTWHIYLPTTLRNYLDWWPQSQ